MTSRITDHLWGTNTIQALDLLGRKVLLDGGAKLRKFLALVAAFTARAQHTAGMAEFLEPLSGAARKLEKLTLELAGRAMQNRDEVGAAAADYLRVLGHVAFASLGAHGRALALTPRARRRFLYDEARDGSLLF